MSWDVFYFIKICNDPVDLMISNDIPEDGQEGRNMSEKLKCICDW